MLGEAVNRAIFTTASADADLSIIEGMMGLFDGSSPVNEIGSTAELAKQLDAPVLLVIDGSAMARSAAAMVSGYAKFDPALKWRVSCLIGSTVKGIISCSRKRSSRATNVMVVGYLRPDPAVTISDRHLGLVTAMEQGTGELYDRLAKAAADTIDLDRVEVPGPIVRSDWRAAPQLVRQNQRQTVRIGVAYDEAFCFYYPDNLELLEAEGAEMVKFSPLHDQMLPRCGYAVFRRGLSGTLWRSVGGECHHAKRQSVDFAEQGGTIYAECGG